jgi:hypothetical protein
LVSLRVTLKLPARDGNTCYRPSSDSSILRNRFQEALSEMNHDVQLSFEEIMVTASDPTNEITLVLNGRPLSDWIDDMDEPYRNWWESKGKQTLTSGQLEALFDEGVMKDIVSFVLTN